MPDQLTLELKEAGIQRAVEHANAKDPDWSDKAFAFLLGYMNVHKIFMVEDVRLASAGFVSEPPSKRAWGAVILRAKSMGLVRHLKYEQTNNPLAHGTPASVWIVNDLKLSEINLELEIARKVLFG